jgi:hypothetical protein
MKSYNNWTNKLDQDLGEKLDLYFSHYPALVGKTDDDFIEEKQKIEAILSTAYKWETHPDDSLAIIVINIGKHQYDPSQLLEEMSMLVQERIELLKKKDYLIIIEDDHCRWNVSESPILLEKVTGEEHNVLNLSSVCSSFNDLIEVCDNKKIALKFFYKVDQEKINQLFFVNSFWIQ